MLRSRGRSLGLVAALLGLLPSVAHAHTGVGPVDGFAHGFTHPLLGVDHLLAMVAVGLWAAQRGGRAVWALPLAFVGAMVLGGALGATGISLPGVETGILASVLVMGALIAAAARFPVALGAAAVAVFALFHGHAHGTEMPAATSALFYALGFSAATALLHGAGVLGAVAAGHARLAHPHRWVRLAGASIGVAGLVLWVL